jgi:hypothetical protein
MRLTGLANAYLRPAITPWQTLTSDVRVDLRGHSDQPWQTPLGGDEGVRGYASDELPTGSVAVASVEDRINLPVIFPAFDLGLTAFGDVGRGWAGDTPFALETGWRSSLGTGLRIGLPAGSGASIRAELAWPVGPTGNQPLDQLRGRKPSLRVYWSAIRTSR